MYYKLSIKKNFITKINKYMINLQKSQKFQIYIKNENHQSFGLIRIKLNDRRPKKIIHTKI